MSDLESCFLFCKCEFSQVGYSIYKIVKKFEELFSGLW